MPNWGNSMLQSYEFWEVDKGTWGDLRKLDTVLTCKGTRDLDLETVETANLDIVGEPMGEMLVRCYMVTTQNRVRERIPVGTWLSQGTKRNFDGTSSKLEAECHSTLMPLHDRSEAGAKVPVGYCIPAGTNCADMAAQILRNHGIAPVVASKSEETLEEPYVAGMQDSWLKVAKALGDASGMRIGVDSWGRSTVFPSNDGYVQAPLWTFQDDGESILLPDADEELDFFDVPNVCEVVWNNGGRTVVGRAVNDDPNSNVSTVARGYEVILRLENPDELQSGCTQKTADLVALQKLIEASKIERIITISHGWCPVTVGDPVRVSYESAGIFGLGTVQSMDFEVGTGMTSTTKVSVSQNVWRAS